MRLRHLSLANAASLAVLVALLSEFLIRAWHGLWFLAFVDEANHLLGGLMLNRGRRLYGNYIDQHGPVTFMLTQFFGAVTGWGMPGSVTAWLVERVAAVTGLAAPDRAAYLAAHCIPNLARLISVVLALASMACVASAPSPGGRLGQAWAASLFIGFITSAWLVQGLYFVNYHEIGGCFVAAALGLYAVPAWECAKLAPWRAYAAAACLVLAVGTSYPFAAAAAPIWIGMVWAARNNRDGTGRALLQGGLATGLLTLAWLGWFGSIPGYIAFHVVENQRDVVPFSGVTLANYGRMMTPAFTPETRIQAMALLCAYGGLAIFLTRMLAARRWRMLGPCLLALIGVALLCARCNPFFQNGEFVVAAIAWGSLALGQLAGSIAQRFTPAWRAVIPVCLLIPVGLSEWNARQALYTPLASRARKPWWRRVTGWACPTTLCPTACGN